MSGRHENPDPTPLVIPVGFRRPPSMQEMIQRYVRHELSQAAQQDGNETFEEADDFDVGDDDELRSPYEITADQELAAALKAELPAAPAAEPAPPAGPAPAPAPPSPEASSPPPP